MALSSLRSASKKYEATICQSQDLVETVAPYMHRLVMKLNIEVIDLEGVTSFGYHKMPVKLCREEPKGIPKVEAFFYVTSDGECGVVVDTDEQKGLTYIPGKCGPDSVGVVLRSMRIRNFELEWIEPDASSPLGYPGIVNPSDTRRKIKNTKTWKFLAGTDCDLLLSEANKKVNTYMYFGRFYINAYMEGEIVKIEQFKMKILETKRKISSEKNMLKKSKIIVRPGISSDCVMDIVVPSFSGEPRELSGMTKTMAVPISLTGSWQKYDAILLTYIEEYVTCPRVPTSVRGKSIADLIV